MSKLLIPEPPLQVLPRLAIAVGLNEAIVLQQLHYLLQNPTNGAEVNGERWIFNTIEEWITTYFPFWCPRTLRTIFGNLQKKNLIITCQPEGRKSRRKYYRINEWQLDAISEEAKIVTSKRQNSSLPVTKTTTKRSKETLSPKRERERVSRFTREDYDEIISKLDHLAMGKRPKLYEELSKTNWTQPTPDGRKPILNLYAYLFALNKAIDDASRGKKKPK